MKEYELNLEDYKNVLVFLSRVDLKGTESATHVVLIQKFSKLIQENEKPKVVETEPVEEPVEPEIKE